MPFLLIAVKHFISACNLWFLVNKSMLILKNWARYKFIISNMYTFLAIEVIESGASV